MTLKKMRNLLMFAAMGAIPLATVSSCDFGDGYGTFMARRFARIYPNYFVWLVIAVLAAFAIELKNAGTLRLGGEEALSFAMHVAMVQSLLGAPVMWNVPLWSIAVEMIAYLIFPLLALAQARARERMFAFGPALALAGLTLLSATLTLDVVEGWPSVLRCLGGFLLGLSISGRTPDELPALASRLSAVQAAAFAGAFASAAAGLEIAAVASFALLVFATSVNRGVRRLART